MGLEFFIQLATTDRCSQAQNEKLIIHRPKSSWLTERSVAFHMFKCKRKQSLHASILNIKVLSLPRMVLKVRLDVCRSALVSRQYPHIPPVAFREYL